MRLICVCLCGFRLHARFLGFDLCFGFVYLCRVDLFVMLITCRFCFVDLFVMFFCFVIVAFVICLFVSRLRLLVFI